MTTAQAQRVANALLGWGYTDVVVIEPVPSRSIIRVAGLDRDGTMRTIRSTQDFIDTREREAKTPYQRAPLQARQSA